MPGDLTSDSDGPLKKATVRNWLLQWVNSGTSTLVAVQQLFGVKVMPGASADRGAQVVSLNTAWHAVFVLAAAFGNELFLGSWAMILCWFFDEAVCANFMLMWLTQYYVGQALKDMLRLPRPVSARVVRLESHYAAEYGLPSTHAMASVSLPVIFFMALWNGYRHVGDTSAEFALLVFCGLWFFVTPLSRLYLGVHSPADVITGALLGACLAVFTQNVTQPALEEWMSGGYGWGSVAFVLLVAIALCALYPKPRRWTNAAGDTTLIIATGVGVWVGIWFTHHCAGRVWWVKAPYTTFRVLTLPPPATLVKCVLRVVLGYPLVYMVRLVFKPLLTKLLVAVLPPETQRDGKPRPPAKRYAIELPIKFFVYFFMGFTSATCVPVLMDTIGLRIHYTTNPVAIS